MNGYKIRNKNTGLFSKGGSYVQSTSDPRHVKFWWSTTGKTWSSRAALMGHLAQYVKFPYVSRYDKDAIKPTVNIPEDWEIVEVKVVVESAANAKDFYIQHSEHFKK